MNEQYLFSVIIPTYNTGKIICDTLDSLVTQTYKNFEVIVSDDGSSDNTLEYVRQYSDKLNLKILSNPNWGGPARPRNLGIKQSSAEWIAFLDHDDFWYKDKLKDTLELLAENDVIFHDLEIFCNAKKTIRVIKSKNLQPHPFINLMIDGNTIANSSVIVRKSIIEKVNYIDESRELMAVEDYDLWLKIARITDRFFHIKKVLGGYRIVPGQNMTASNQKQIARYTYVNEKYALYLSEEDKITSKATLSYSNARIYHKIAQYFEARQNYKNALKAKRIDIKLKAMIGIIQLFFNQ